MSENGFWSGRKVLVTGAGGFIGSHLAERLVEAGASVRALVHYNAMGTRGWLDGSLQAETMEIISGDVTDSDSVGRAVAGIDTVFHLAALIAIPYSYQVPRAYVRANIDGTLNVLQAAREASVRRIVHTSTSEVYGTARRVPIDETHPLQGQSPYSASKIAADKMAEAFYCSFNLPVAILRPFNTFGPRQSARAIIPTILAQGLSGGVVKLGSLHPTRDLNFVANTVDGYLLAGEVPSAVGQTIHLGSGREISIGDLVELLAKLVGCKPRIETDARRIRPEKSEVDRLVADPSRAKEILGWSPRVSLEEGLKRTVEWMRANADRYRPGSYVV